MKSPLNFMYDENATIYTELLPERAFCVKPRGATVPIGLHLQHQGQMNVSEVLGLLLVW